MELRHLNMSVSYYTK